MEEDGSLFPMARQIETTLLNGTIPATYLHHAVSAEDTFKSVFGAEDAKKDEPFYPTIVARWMPDDDQKIFSGVRPLQLEGFTRRLMGGVEGLRGETVAEIPGETALTGKESREQIPSARHALMQGRDTMPNCHENRCRHDERNLPSSCSVYPPGEGRGARCERRARARRTKQQLPCPHFVHRDPLRSPSFHCAVSNLNLAHASVANGSPPIHLWSVDLSPSRKAAEAVSREHGNVFPLRTQQLDYDGDDDLFENWRAPRESREELDTEWLTQLGSQFTSVEIGVTELHSASRRREEAEVTRQRRRSVSRRERSIRVRGRSTRFHGPAIPNVSQAFAMALGTEAQEQRSWPERERDYRLPVQHPLYRYKTERGVSLFSPYSNELPRRMLRIETAVTNLIKNRRRNAWGGGDVQLPESSDDWKLTMRKWRAVQKYCGAERYSDNLTFHQWLRAETALMKAYGAAAALTVDEFGSWDVFPVRVPSAPNQLLMCEVWTTLTVPYKNLLSAQFFRLRKRPFAPQEPSSSSSSSDRVPSQEELRDSN